MNKLMTLPSSVAIHFTGVSNIKTFIPKESGEYSVSSNSTLKSRFRRSLDQQVLLFNTALLDAGETERWYFSLSNLKKVKVNGQQGKPIYIFLVEQLDANVASEKITVTFTRV